MNPAVEIVVRSALERLPEDARGRFLRDLMATAAAGPTMLEGERASSEAVYRLGDAIVVARLEGS